MTTDTIKSLRAQLKTAKQEISHHKRWKDHYKLLSSFGLGTPAKLLATQQVLLDVFRVHYAPELFKAAHVRESKKRIADNGGTLAYVVKQKGRKTWKAKR